MAIEAFNQTLPESQNWSAAWHRLPVSHNMTSSVEMAMGSGAGHFVVYADTACCACQLRKSANGWFIRQYLRASMTMVQPLTCKTSLASRTFGCWTSGVSAETGTATVIDHARSSFVIEGEGTVELAQKLVLTDFGLVLEAKCTNFATRTITHPRIADRLLTGRMSFAK